MNKLNILFAIFATVLVSACESEPGENLQNSIDTTNGVVSNFDPANSIIPFPNNLLFQGSADGTLNIPVADVNDLSDPAVAMNALDGFSTSAPMTIGFTGAIKEASINGDSVKVYDVNLSGTGGAVIGINSQLTYGVDYVAVLSSIDTTNSTLVILPIKPLVAKSHYYVVITKELKAADGSTIGATAAYALTKGADPLHVGGVSVIPQTLSDTEAQSLEPLRQLNNASESTLLAFDNSLAASDITLSWSFSTQSTSDVLEQVRNLAQTTNAPVINGFSLIGDTAALLGAGPGLANVYAGSLTLPYYQTNATVPTDPLSKYWQGAGATNLTQFNTTPIKTSDETIPLLLTVPKVGSAPWPVVIFQHGITADRTSVLAIADALAGAGFVAVAIDMPLHGLAPSHPLYSGIERTFDLDLVDNTTSAPGADAVVDTSGTHFINLSNLLVMRDNVRQSVADLLALHVSLATLDYDGGGADLDTSKIYFVGHSLGAMVGTVFTALEPNVRDAAFAFGGVSIPKILDGSATFGPIVSGGLAAKGVLKGTADYESFMGAAQTVVDSGDPVNYASVAATGRGILFFEIVGGNSSPSDLVMPNRVPDANDTTGTVPAPLAGTEPQLALMGLTQYNASTTGTDLHAVTKYISGDHSSLLDPISDVAVTTEIQTQLANFLASDGAALVVTDDTLLQAPAP
ncbi:MAG: lipase [Gammaproteobacteria bacterium]|nr:lipase [Gammaproteobacteria bacterium]MCW8923676.1 lipase [Gammaproteobacteria bacterium]